jgi:hypothetical protein
MGPPTPNRSFQTARCRAEGFPLAPEDDEFSQEIRQMVVGRYRVLFTIKGREVHVLHVRGAHPGRIDQLEEDR